MKLLSILLFASVAFLALACDDDETVSPTPTPGAAESATPGEPTATPRSSERGTPLPDVGSAEPFSFPALPEPQTEPALLTNVRVGAHPEDGGFDRIVFEFEAGRPAGTIEYRDDVTQCGSGMPVDPEGNATLWVHFDFTNAHNEAGELTIDSTIVPGPGNSILEAESICDFEAVVEWAIGVDGERPFTVALLEDPSRVVIDVAH